MGAIASNLMNEPDPPPPAERRWQFRRRSFLAGLVVHSGGRFSFGCKIKEISTTGAQIAFAPGSLLSSHCYLVNRSSDVAYYCEVVWATSASAGFEFLETFAMTKLPPEVDFLKRFR